MNFKKTLFIIREDKAANRDLRNNIYIYIYIDLDHIPI